MGSQKASKLKPPGSEFGALLRQWRDERGYSQAELARNAGLGHSSHVSLMERGYSHPEFETARRLAAALDVPMDSFWKAVSRSKQEHSRRNYLPTEDIKQSTFAARSWLPYEVYCWVEEESMATGTSMSAFILSHLWKPYHEYRRKQRAARRAETAQNAE